MSGETTLKDQLIATPQNGQLEVVLMRFEIWQMDTTVNINKMRTKTLRWTSTAVPNGVTFAWSIRKIQQNKR